MKYYGSSDIGRVRTANQDSYLTVSNQDGDVFAVVCDGIGGGNAGDVASSLAVRYLGEQFAQVHSFASSKEIQSWLSSCFAKANDYIYHSAQINSQMAGMGTTCVGCVISLQGNFVANVGDSRAYGYDESGELVQITRDHNVAFDLFKRGEISKQEIATHPKRNIVTKALGMRGTLKPDLFELAPQVSQLLLCTDGLHGYVPEQFIGEVLGNTKYSLRKKVSALIDLANKAGGFDNTTVVLLALDRREL
ncbi:MAG: Stp1/IreP family PP2C-type Ser/Thr phosphatase [Erysipelotrichaceae bacterium]|jgi:protein phosphatase|nr:Stp1/IreP family PP2C-type Ser/Thr phosphatase [Erysipelotrichaceae bacterium]